MFPCQPSLKVFDSEILILFPSIFPLNLIFFSSHLLNGPNENSLFSTFTTKADSYHSHFPCLQLISPAVVSGFLATVLGLGVELLLLKSATDLSQW